MTADQLPPASLPPDQRPLDPRRQAFRPDLAAAHLRGLVQAASYTAGVPAQIGRAAIALRKLPVPSAPLETEALFGERARVYDIADGWAWVQLETDGYVGYLPADTLSHDVREPTHRVRALGTFVYAVPDIKSPPVMHLSLNSLLTVADTSDRFYALATGGYVIARHVAEIGWRDRDFVEVAERFIGTPYLWGGRSRIGLDCSALVQVSMAACGIAAPRDSDMQRDELGTTVLIPDDLEGLQRGDLLFWPGHVGMMSDGVMLVHANAHHMAVATEPLPEAVARIKGTGADIVAIRRLDHKASVD